ncbi:MAG: diacylglycerol O-acyltransferase [Cellvibrionaceae bacterium]|jgi:diacylglycerol O-acyltransferase
MEALTGLDASFLYLETPRSHMHVGGLAVIDGSLKFEEFRSRILSRIHQIPKLRQRLIEVPMSIDYPYWVDDANFNIDNHLIHVRLPEPGNWKELRKLASQMFSRPLDRVRPLWEFIFVEGLDNIPQVAPGSVAIISKMHHAAIDGQAGAGIMAILFDFSPDVKPDPEPRPFKPEPLPGDLQIIARSTKNLLSDPLKFPKILAEAASSTVRAGMLSRVQNIEMPAVPFSAPPSVLNGIISPQRKWNTAILSLDRVKKLKSVMGTTVNDVLLAICAGALRRYLLEKGKLPNRSLVSMIPVSTRAKGKGGTGNEVANMLVQIATNIEAPVERLETIHANTMRGKVYQNAVGANSLANMAELVPFGLANQATRLYSRYQIAKIHNPVYNVVITNVPGPPIPLYLGGHKLQSMMGMAPITDGMGLIITIFSYDGQITISPTSDESTMPDIDLFTRYLWESANELETAILELEEVRKEAEKLLPKTAKSDAMFEYLAQFLQENPDYLRPGAGRFQYKIIGDIESDWIMDFSESPGRVKRGVIDNPDATLTIRDDHFMRLARKEIDYEIAIVQGRMKIDGNLDQVLKLGGIIAGIPIPGVSA